MEQAKHKNNPDILRRYWHFFIPLAFILSLMVKFPLRINLRESFWDAVFYGTILLFCIATAIKVYYSFGKRGYRLIAAALLCSGFAVWQIVDMVILRDEGPSFHSYRGLATDPANVLEPFHHGSTWYDRRFPDGGGCYGISEQYIGNNFIAIAYNIDRNAIRMGCGG